MRERAEAVGGVLTIHSEGGKGTWIEARLPLQKSAVYGRKSEEIR
jgi:signal transduction histidine kinase